jgi:peptidyl-prolyl cis-trans isomerase C
MKKFCILALLVLAVFSCAKKDTGKTLATIDNETITLEEFNKELDKVPMNMRMLVATESGKKNYLDRIVMKRLLLREAKKEKIEGEKEFQDRLTDIKDQLLIESLLKKKVVTDAKTTDEDLKNYYEAHKEQFKRGREISTRHILLKTQEEAKKVLERVKAGDDFAELAKTYSIDPSAKASGGDLGFHPQGSLVPEYEEAAFKLKKVGDVSGIVKTKFGYHIIKLEGVKPPAYASFDDVKDYIKQNIGQAKQTETIEKYIEELKKSSKITINEALLKSEDKEEGKTKAEPKKEEPVKEEPKTKPAEAPAKK